MFFLNLHDHNSLTQTVAQRLFLSSIPNFYCFSIRKQELERIIIASERADGYVFYCLGKKIVLKLDSCSRKPGNFLLEKLFLQFLGLKMHDVILRQFDCLPFIQHFCTCFA